MFVFNLIVWFWYLSTGYQAWVADPEHYCLICKVGGE